LTEPTLSVVIGSAGPAERLEKCLLSLEPQLDERVEVLVCEAQPSPAGFRARFPWASFAERPGALVPELWTDGIDRSTGEIVALTIAPVEVAVDWIPTIRAQHERYEAVGGAIEPGTNLRLRDWAEYFCRYARDMLPFEPHRCLDLPGDNAAYRRALLERTRELYRDGFWEPTVHRELAGQGVMLWHAPELVVTHGRSFGWRAFARQRLAHGRAYGRQRGSRFGAARNAVGVVAAPAVALLMSARALREVRAKQRHGRQALLASPFVLTFNLAWALGEARGHLDALRDART
jgi:hypothetical protein